MGIALQHLPISVPGDGGDLMDVPIGLEQAADAFVAQIVEVQILDRQVAADTAEGSSDRTTVIRKDEAGGAVVISPCCWIRAAGS